MSDYCLLPAVQKYLPTSYWDSAAAGCEPAAADVTAWITEVSGEMDSRLAARYALPITGLESLSMLSSIAARLTAIRVWGLVFAGAAADSGGAALPPALKDARKLLDDLARGDASLPDASPIGAASVGAVGHPHGTFRVLEDDPLLDTPTAPVFPLDRDF